MFHVNQIYLFRVIVAIILALMVIHNAHCEAWIVEAGKYKYSIGHMTIDKGSHKKKKLHQQQQQELLKKEYVLSQEREKLRIRNPNSKKIAEIDKEIELINKERDQISGPSDQSYSKLEVEYGLKEKNSVGAVIIYDVNNFNQQYSKSNSAEAYFKHLLWQNDDYIITMIPRFSFLNYNTDTNKTFVSNGLFIGRSISNEDESCNYREIGLNIAKTINKTPYKDKRLTVIFQEGYKYPSGISIANYIELEYVKNKKRSEEFNFFEQISVAKTFNIASFGDNDCTLQLGYFWKGSLKEDFDTISGPIISLWFTI